MVGSNFGGGKHIVASFLLVVLTLLVASESSAQVPLRQKIGQMVMVTMTGDSLDGKASPSVDTMKSDLANGFVGGVIMFTWSNNLRNPQQIAHLTKKLQEQSSTPLFICIDEEGGQVARLSAANGFANTPSEFQLGSANNESNTRATASTMAGWFMQTGLNLNLAPVVDVNVNPNSPAIGALGRSFSSNPDIVAANASWFIDEFHKKNILTTLKHFPGHGSAATDSHLGLVDITYTWSDKELTPYRQLLSAGKVDAIMTAHVFNAKLDSLYPATLSQKILTGILRNQLGYNGVVVSDDMSMQAIVSYYGFDDAVTLAVNAGLDILLYTSNLHDASSSRARHVVDLIERKVKDGTIDAKRIDDSYNRVMALKRRSIASGVEFALSAVPDHFILRNYPNPFNPSTTIAIQIPQREHVSLKIFDLLGREIVTLLDDNAPAGTRLVTWNASNLASGIYIAQLRTSREIHNLKMVLLK
ncbi:MAG: T9SS type A sorting domain-containing protein [Ignavibacteriales bacterium]|nr:T9SS type A sorting domain-containing protein [Ignavibacteriales bacterium]